MRVLAVASQKGGSGKTMLAAHLAVQAAAAGAGPVVLIDVDPQGALPEWWDKRGRESPALIRTTPERLASDIQTLRQSGFCLAIVDTPSAVSQGVAGVIRLAGLVIVPTRPEGEAIHAATGTVDLCAREGKPLLIVGNGTGAGAVLAPEPLSRLAQNGPVAPHVIPQSAAIAEAMRGGRTVAEQASAHPVAHIIADLWHYVSDRMERNFRRTVFAVPRGGVAAGFGRRGL